jgi:hypothetical protein
MPNFEKVLLHKNDHQIAIDIRFYEPKQKYFQEYIDKYSLLGLKPLETKDLNELFENPKAFLTKQITHGESLNIGGLKMNPEKLFEIIEKPEGTEELIKEIISDKQNQDIASTNHWFTNNFIIANGNKIEVSPEDTDLIIKRNSIYLENEKQAEAIEIMDLIAKKMNRLNELKTSGNIATEDFFTGYINLKEGKYKKDFTSIKHFK